MISGAAQFLLSIWGACLKFKYESWLEQSVRDGAVTGQFGFYGLEEISVWASLEDERLLHALPHTLSFLYSLYFFILLQFHAQICSFMCWKKIFAAFKEAIIKLHALCSYCFFILLSSFLSFYIFFLKYVQLCNLGLEELHLGLFRRWEPASMKTSLRKINGKMKQSLCFLDHVMFVQTWKYLDFLSTATKVWRLVQCITRHMCFI